MFRLSPLVALAAVASGCTYTAPKLESRGVNPPPSAIVTWTPASHDFGPVAVNDASTPVPFALTNTGEAAVTACGSPTVAGANPQAFHILDDGCGITDLAGGESCSLRVAARPPSGGAFSATLERTCTGGGTLTFSVATLTVAGEVSSAPAWIGAVASPAWGHLGDTGAGGPDGGLLNPGGVYVDGNDMLYVSSTSESRVMKFDLANSEYVGWIGAVDLAPTGGERGVPGCDGLAWGDITPGWCTGGSPVALGADGGYDGPRHLTGDGQYLYIVNGDSSGHIQRVVAASGAPAGWIGRISVTPTGGDNPLCSLAVEGTVTPGWCSGGEPISGAADAEVDGAPGTLGPGNGPTGIWHDGGYLYVINPVPGRIQRYALSSGAFAGWIGRISTLPPTDGDPGCVGTVGQFTPGWCRGGNSTRSLTRDGSLSQPTDITGTDSDLYVADNQVLQRFDLVTGAYAGWLGAGDPLTGSAICDAAPGGSFTGDWCTGGESIIGSSTDGSLQYAFGIQTDGPHLYTTVWYLDSIDLVERYDVGGAFQGWLGGVGGIAPDLDLTAGCETAPPGSPTPGWCRGGSTTGGIGPGLLLRPGAIAVANGAIYVADQDNHRIATFAAATGAFTGNIGTASSPANWATSGSAAYAIGPDYAFDAPRGIALAEGELYVADFGNARLSRFQVASGESRGWTGTIRFTPKAGSDGCSAAAPGEDTPGWCVGGAATYDDTHPGRASPDGAVGAHTDGLYVYVGDYWNNRLLRFERSTGAYAGWIGWMMDARGAEGAPGCATASDSFTPGWCKGGRSTSGNADGAFNIPMHAGIAGDGIYLFVSDDAGRISRYVAASGAFAGWVGGVGDSANMRDADSSSTCGNPAVGEATSGWCLGGAADVGTGNGWLHGPAGLAYADGHLYVADHWNHRVVRYDTLSGAFEGWIGNADQQPEGGAAGCNTMGVDQFTPGWCTGGHAAFTDERPGFHEPIGVFSDGRELFVTDTADTVQKIRLNGGAVEYVGWRGRVLSSPTRGEPGCVGLNEGDITPGWCADGSVWGDTRTATGVAITRDVSLLTGDASYLYIADAGSHRILRLPR